MRQDYDLSRQMPASVDAERAILGAVLLFNDCFTQTFGAIEAEDFSLDSHRRIFLAMGNLVDAGSPIDYTILGNELRKKGELESVGGDQYVIGLTDGLPRVRNIASYVKIVREKSQLRSMVHLGAAMTDRAYSAGEDPGEIIGDVQQQLLDIYRKGGKQTPTLEDCARECLNDMAEQQSRQMDGCIGLTTGLRELDDATTGYRNSDYYIIGGRPSSGKSSLALQSIRANCRADHRCAFFSIEMTNKDVFKRLASMETGIRVCDLRDMRTLSRADSLRVQEAWAAIAKWPLALHCGPHSIRELKAKAKTEVAKGAEIILVDYLQHPSLKVLGIKTEFDRVTAISSELCDMGKANNVPVVALSQLSRPDRRGPVRDPRLEDLRQSGQIEQDADVVALLHRPEEDNGDDRPRFTGLDKIILAKQRNGPASEYLPVWFDGPMSVYKPRHMRGMTEQAPAVRDYA